MNLEDVKLLITSAGVEAIYPADADMTEVARIINEVLIPMANTKHKAIVCPNCGKFELVFDAGRYFCSDRCRNNHNVKMWRRKMSGEEVPEPQRKKGKAIKPPKPVPEGKRPRGRPRKTA